MASQGFQHWHAASNSRVGTTRRLTMRTHILIALVALVVTACASKDHPGQAQQAKQDERQEMQTKSEYSQIDGAASRIR